MCDRPRFTLQSAGPRMGHAALKSRLFPKLGERVRGSMTGSISPQEVVDGPRAGTLKGEGQQRDEV